MERYKAGTRTDPRKWEEARRQTAHEAAGDTENQAQLGESWTAGKRVESRQRHTLASPGRGQSQSKPGGGRGQASSPTLPCPLEQRPPQHPHPGPEVIPTSSGESHSGQPRPPTPWAPLHPARGATGVQRRRPPTTHWKPGPTPTTSLAHLSPLDPTAAPPHPTRSACPRGSAHGLLECCPQEGLSTRTCKHHLIWENAFEDVTEVKVLK